MNAVLVAGFCGFAGGLKSAAKGDPRSQASRWLLKFRPPSLESCAMAEPGAPRNQGNRPPGARSTEPGRRDEAARLTYATAKVVGAVWPTDLDLSRSERDYTRP